MGYGSYRASDWAKLKESRGISSSSSTQEMFRNRNFKDIYNPLYINMRESCDSEDSPESTPIIIAFDNTGSMGFLAKEIAAHALNKTATNIYDKKPVTNPHIMCAAFVSPSDRVIDNYSSLQVTQFEADIRIVEQLMDLVVNYGGNRYSYDNLVWYFAAKHTSIDSFNKRNKKGFMFCCGDEICGLDKDILTKAQIKAVFGDDVDSNFSLKELYEIASEKYEIIHIVTNNRRNNKQSFLSWNEFMPGRVAEISSDNINYLSDVIISVLQLASGMKKTDVLSQYSGADKMIVQDAISSITAFDKSDFGYLKNMYEDKISSWKKLWR